MGGYYRPHQTAKGSKKCVRCRHHHGARPISQHTSYAITKQKYETNNTSQKASRYLFHEHRLFHFFDVRILFRTLFILVIIAVINGKPAIIKKKNVSPYITDAVSISTRYESSDSHTLENTSQCKSATTCVLCSLCYASF